MRRVALNVVLVSFISLLALSCARGSHESLVTSLNRNVSIYLKGEEESQYREALIIRCVGESDDPLSFRLSSPNSELIWEGSINGEYSDELAITPGATFLAGDYSLYIYYEDGSNYSNTFSLGQSTDRASIPMFKERVLSSTLDNLTVREYDETGSLIGEESRANGYTLEEATRRVELSYIDRYSNNVTIYQELN